MAGLAEDNLQTPSPMRRWGLAGAVVLALALLIGAGMALKQWLGQPAQPQRQVARISVLPDTPPPPPPPPPKDEPKPAPKDNTRPPPPTADLKPPPPAPAPPADAPIKMEGPAGDGPSAFAAGAVQRDYAGGTPATGTPAAAAASAPAAVATLADRTNDRLYAQSTRQALQGEIERQLNTEAEQLVASLSLWVDRNGSIARLELNPTGNDQHDAELRAALDETRRNLRLAQPPAALVQPLRFRLTVRPQV